MALDHPPHAVNARIALAAFDAAQGVNETRRALALVADALRVLLYEPADGYQGRW